jgi:hypothetical protein
MAVIWFRKRWLNRIISGPPGDCAGCGLKILMIHGRPGRQELGAALIATRK